MAAALGAAAPPPASVGVALNVMIGVRTGVPGGLAYVDETDVQYVAGRTLVRYDLETRQQRVAPGAADAVSGFTAVATTPNRKTTAYAEFGADGFPVVSLLEWSNRAGATSSAKRHKKTIGGIDARAPVTHMSFTGDGKFLLVMTGSPVFALYYVEWQRGSFGRVAGTCKNVTTSDKPVAQVDAAPSDAGLVCVTGHGLFKMLRFLEKEESFRPLPTNLRREPCALAGHCWMADNERLLLATRAGELLVAEGGDVKKTLDVPAQGGLKAVHCLVATSKGFLLGCEAGLLRVYERAEDTRLFYRLARQYPLQVAPPGGSAPPSTDAAFAAGAGAGVGGSGVLFAGAAAPASGSGAEITVGGKAGSTFVALAVSPTEDDVVVSTAVGQAFLFHLAANELQKASEAVFLAFLAPMHQTLQLPDGLGTPEAPLPPANTLALHSDPRVAHSQNAGVTGLDTCIRKPLFVSCGGDKTVRIWNLMGTSLNHTGLGGGEGGAAGGAGSDGNRTLQLDIAPALEVVQRFSEAPTSVALHPSGVYIVVGFEGSLQLMAVMMDCVRLVKEMPVRAVSDVRFSHNGAMFAACSGSVVVVFSTYGCAQVCSLRGHADRVLGVAWARDDRSVVTVGKDGLVARWSVVVPNATSAGTVPGGAAAAPGRRTSAQAASDAAGPLALVGKMTHSVELRDMHPFSVGTGGLGSHGMDVYVAGVGVKGMGASAVLTPQLRHVDFATATKAEPARAQAALAGAAPHSVVLARGAGGAAFALLAGMGCLVQAKAGAPPAAGSAAATAALASAAAAAATASASATTALAVGAAASGAPASAAPPAAPADELDPSGCLRVYRPTLALDKAAQLAAAAAAANAAASGTLPSLLVSSSSSSSLMSLASVSGSASPSAAASSASAAGASSSAYADHVAHAGPITCMRFTPDGQVLITGSADGSIGLWSITDPSVKAAASAAGAGGAASGAGIEALPWSEEVCVTKRDLDSVVRERSELEARVSEVTLQNRYAERKKDAADAAKLAELRAEFADEIDAEHAKLADLREQLEAMETRFNQQTAELERAQARDLGELEALYSGKVGGELERYDRLVRERDRMNAEFEAGMAALREEQERDVAQLKAEYEARLAEEDAAVAEFEVAGAKLGEESKRTAHAIEQDVDKEVEDMRARFETRLVLESKATLLLKGENGFMKRKFVAVSKEMADQKEEQQQLADKERELLEAISALHKDVAGHKKEIREREETVGEKEARIAELKKKNQELEKFKFVLNYKIQELKRQIMPRKKEIADMREQLKEMELELLQYHKSNAALDLMIGELRLKRDGMATEVKTLEAELQRRAETLVDVGRDVRAVHMVVHDAKALRAAMTQLYRKFIYADHSSLALSMTGGGGGGLSGSGEPQESLAKRLSKQGLSALPPGVNLEDLQTELTHQRQHLERGVDGLRRRIAKESAAAGLDRGRLLRENSALTQEINDLRRDVRYLHATLEATLRQSGEEAAGSDARAGTGAGAAAGAGAGAGATAAAATAASSLSGRLRRTAAVLGVTTGLKAPAAAAALAVTGGGGARR